MGSLQHDVNLPEAEGKGEANDAYCHHISLDHGTGIYEVPCEVSQHMAIATDDDAEAEPIACGHDPCRCFPEGTNDISLCALADLVILQGYHHCLHENEGVLFLSVSASLRVWIPKKALKPLVTSWTHCISYRGWQAHVRGVVVRNKKQERDGGGPTRNVRHGHGDDLQRVVNAVVRTELLSSLHMPSEHADLQTADGKVHHDDTKSGCIDDHHDENDDDDDDEWDDEDDYDMGEDSSECHDIDETE